jgi:protein-L-isoaspartate O-methyltransferase
VLVIPVGRSDGRQELLRCRKKQGEVTREAVIPVAFVPLIHEP